MIDAGLGATVMKRVGVVYEIAKPGITADFA